MSIFGNIRTKIYIINKTIKKLKAGGEAFCTNKIAQKCLSVAVSLTLAVGMVPGKMAQAAEPTVFTASAYANHWGRCDKRAHLNNATKTNNTLPLDTTIDGTNSGNFPAKFSDAEFGLVQPVTCETNVLNRNKEATAVYETTDKFWLPSGNFNKNQLISWAKEDISSTNQVASTTGDDKARIIPISYWSYGASAYSWLRSPNYDGEHYALRAYRGHDVNHNHVNHRNATAAACKINLESDICGSVIFASAASAANLAAAGGAQKIEISESNDFGKKTEAALPGYGMYLKTQSDKDFTATSISLSGNNLTVGYTGGESGQYVVIQAFKEDSLTAGTTGYAAAGAISSANSSVTIDVTNWGISSLDGYTVKVWMEDNTGSLAKATVPTTLGTGAHGAVKNGRVFAMKEDLQCSWGSLANATDFVGEGATNQKIYFGSHNGSPMEFWIAGRETAADGGAIDKDGNIMTLYQAKSVETRMFNAAYNNYDVADKPAVTLQLTEDPSTLPYPESKITKANLAADCTLVWQHRQVGATAWTDSMPTEVGTYEARCYAPGTDNYERTYSNVVSVIVKKTPKSSDFTFSHPKDMVYDGKGKVITIEPKPGITGMGAVTVKYYKVNADGSETELEGPPIDVGKYRAKIHVDEGNAYNAAIIVIMF